MSRSHAEIPDPAGLDPALVTRLREAAPLVQCITNTVTTNLVASAVIAIGGSPAMVDITGEAGPFAQIAGGLLINLGTPPAEQRAAMHQAARAAAEAGTPWVIDPIGFGALPVRTQLARELIELGPTVIRGNASEIRALAGSGSGARGVDAVDGVDEAEADAISVSRETGAVVAVSGAVDLVTDGSAVARIANGDPLFTRITGAGCALGAVIAAFAAVAEDPFSATIAACTSYAVAGELAAERAGGPGSFVPELLDALDRLDAGPVAERARVSLGAPTIAAAR